MYIFFKKYVSLGLSQVMQFWYYFFKESWSYYYLDWNKKIFEWNYKNIYFIFYTLI